MTKFGISIGLIGALFAISRAFAADDNEPLKRLTRAHALTCQFGRGTAGAWEDGKLSVESVEWGKEATHFDAINLKAKTAQLNGNLGSSSVSVLWSPTALHFFETTSTGNFMATSVFAQVDSKGRFIAVTSRHIDLVAGLVTPSQYYGTCVISK